MQSSVCVQSVYAYGNFYPNQRFGWKRLLRKLFSFFAKKNETKGPPFLFWTLFLYCLKGMRSRRAAGILRKAGYNARSIGGIKQYKGSKE